MLMQNSGNGSAFRHRHEWGFQYVIVRLFIRTSAHYCAVQTISSLSGAALVEEITAFA
jgi:hypothetical protein